jgi:hypothetical protein
MAALNFPSSPTDGQTYTANDAVFVYNASIGVWDPQPDPAALFYANSEILVLDNISTYFDGVTSRFQPTIDGNAISIDNQLRLILTIDGVIQEVNAPDTTWMSEIPRWGFRIDAEGFIQFTEAPPIGSVFNARLFPGSDTDTATNQYPFNAVDILLGV